MPIYYHTVDCEVPVVNNNVKPNYNSTLDGSVLILTCENEIDISTYMHMNTTDEQVLRVTCHSSGNWIPDPAQFTCSEFATVPPSTGIIMQCYNVVACICEYTIIYVIIIICGYIFLLILVCDHDQQILNIS